MTVGSKRFSEALARTSRAMACAAALLSAPIAAGAQDLPISPAFAAAPFGAAALRLSPSCEAPVGDIASPAPLPHLQANMQAGKLIRVLAIGSSSTVGIGASSPALNYPSVFESILEGSVEGLNVVISNHGVSGEVAATTAERLRILVAMEKPNLVLWQVGTNDALSRVPLGDFVLTVRDTVRWLRERRIDTVLVGLQYTPHVAKDERYRALQVALRNLAVSENVMLVRRYEAMKFIAEAKSGQLLSADQFHLNDLGYRCMAEHVARAVVAGALLGEKPGLMKP